MSKDNTSRYISYLLRHHPETAGLTIDGNGWAKVDDLIEAVKSRKDSTFSRESLEEIVETDSKGRYSFSEDGTKIRANHGHSIPVDLQLEPITPPDTLFHGTSTRFLSSILSEGILPMNRNFVHLSANTERAKQVGRRHGEPVILQIDARKMQEDGFLFYLSATGIWLTERVPREYFEVL